MDTNRYIERNNVLFDTLLPSGRKGDDSRRKHTNLFFMLDPYFHPSVSVSGAWSLPPVQLYFPKDDLSSVCVCVCLWVCVRACKM